MANDEMTRYERGVIALGKIIGTAIVILFLLSITAVGAVIAAFIVLVLRSLAA